MTSFLDSEAARVEDSYGRAPRFAWEYRPLVAPRVSSTSASLRYVAARRHLFIGSSEDARGLSRVHELGQSARGPTLPTRRPQCAPGRAERGPGGGPAPFPLTVCEFMRLAWRTVGAGINHVSRPVATRTAKCNSTTRDSLVGDPRDLPGLQPPAELRAWAPTRVSGGCTPRRRPARSRSSSWTRCSARRQPPGPSRRARRSGRERSRTSTAPTGAASG